MKLQKILRILLVRFSYKLMLKKARLYGNVKIKCC